MIESKSSTLLESKSLTLKWPGWTGALAFGLGLLAIFVVRVIREWPLAVAFQNFAFKDTGSFRYVNSLLDMGLRPSVDFGFSYGPVSYTHLDVYKRQS